MKLHPPTGGKVIAFGMILLLVMPSCDRLRKRLREFTRSAADPGAGSRPPTEVTSQEFRFRLVRPSRDWRLHTAEEATAMHPTFLAAASNADRRLVGAVTTERMPGVSLRVAGAAAATALTWLGGSTTPPTEVQFAGRKALRFEGTLKESGTSLHTVYHVFLNGPYLFRVFVTVIGERAPEQGPEVERFFSSFSVLPGAVTGRRDATVTPDENTAGWRIRGGVAESAVRRLEVRPPRGWRLAGATELAEVNNDAEVALLHEETDTTLVLVFDRMQAVNPDAVIAARREQTAESFDASPTQEPLKVSLLGSPMELRLHGIKDLPMVDYWHGVILRDGLLIELTALMPAGERSRSGVLFKEGLTGVSVLPAARVEALERGSRGGSLVVPAVVGPDHSLRGGVFRHFDAGVTWRTPLGAWRVRTGDRAREYSPSRVLFAEELSLGLFLAVDSITVDGSSLSTLHEVDRSAILDDDTPREAPRALRLAPDVPALSSEATREELGTERRHRMISARVGRRAYRVHLWANRAQLQQVEPSIRAALEGLELKPLVRRAEERGALRDHRLGFAFTPPSRGFRLEDETPEILASAGAVLRWSQKDHQVLLWAVRDPTVLPGETLTPEKATRFVGSAMTALSGRSLTTIDSVLGGKPCRRQVQRGAAASHLDFWFLERQGIVYGLIYERPASTDRVTAADVVAAFGFLD